MPWNGNALLALQGQDEIGHFAQIHIPPFIRLAIFIDKAHIMQAGAFRQANGKMPPRLHGIIAQPIRSPFLFGGKRYIGFHHYRAGLIDQVEGRITGGTARCPARRWGGLRAVLR